MTARPDLATPEGRRAYSAELGGVARGWRYGGLGLLSLSLAGLAARAVTGAPLLQSALGLGTLAALALGWAMVIVGIVKRTRYHRRRMAG